MSFGDHEEIKKMIELFLEESSLTKIHVKKGDQELTLERASIQGPHQIGHPVAYSTASVDKEPKGEEKKLEDSANCAYIKSPMVGTFYLAASPDQPDFVKVGDTVNESTCVCIIEAMKVMNEVKAGVSGVVEEILVDNNQPLEFGTKIFKIKKQ